jgi:hypothetical protein
MSPDGTGIESLLKLNDIGYMTGRVSPDGQQLAFGTLSADGKTWETWIMDADGHRRKVTGDGMMKAWSQDGTMIACFRSNDKGGRRSFLVQVETGKVQHLPLVDSDAVDDWSPVGEVLSVMAGNPGHKFEHPGKGTYPLRQIDLMAIDGSQRRRITSDPLLDNIWSRFSPDGAHIAHYQRWHRADKVFESFVVREKNGNHPVEVIGSDKLDEELREVPTYPSYPYYWSASDAPFWSPYGSRLAACLNNAKSRSHRGEKLWFALVVATPQGRIDHALDLQKLGILFVSSLDWR